MKKYLMMGLATLAFAACVSDKEVKLLFRHKKRNTRRLSSNS